MASSDEAAAGRGGRLTVYLLLVAAIAITCGAFAWIVALTEKAEENDAAGLASVSTMAAMVVAFVVARRVVSRPASWLGAARSILLWLGGAAILAYFVIIGITNKDDAHGWDRTLPGKVGLGLFSAGAIMLLASWAVSRFNIFAKRPPAGATTGAGGFVEHIRDVIEASTPTEAEPVTVPEQTAAPSVTALAAAQDELRRLHADIDRQRQIQRSLTAELDAWLAANMRRENERSRRGELVKTSPCWASAPSWVCWAISSHRNWGNCSARGSADGAWSYVNGQ